MVNSLRWTSLLSAVLLISVASLLPAQGQVGGVRGFLRDKVFEIPAGGVDIKIAQTGQKTKSDQSGNYVLQNVKPGTYTLIFSSAEFRQAVQPDVNVRAGSLTDVSIGLEPEIDELETVIVEEPKDQAPGGELQLLEIRKESPSLVDSISADLISRAGAGNAAEAAGQIAGVAVQGGKTVVIRGLPDRYISSQLNGVRLPTADADKRAVELDQFPSAVIESIQVEKTFTPSQQGDASGGVVDIILKSVPKEPWFLKFNSQVSYNSQVTGKNNFLSSKDGGLGFFGDSPSDRGIQTENIGDSWTGSVGVSREGAPIDYKWALSGGGSHELKNGLRFGGFVSLFYERDSSFDEDGIDDARWITTPGGGVLTPQQFQIDGPEDFKTRLFDVARATREVQFGGLGAFGVETENHKVGMSYLFSRSAEDLAILSEDTRGKQEFFPGYDPTDPGSNGFSENRAAPYSRFETLSYTLRTTTSLQFSGDHTIPTDSWGIRDILEFTGPTVDWQVAFSSADSDQPDKRQFGSEWEPGRETPFFTFPPTFFPLLPAANINLGNLQRIYTEITEESEQYSVNLKLPFEQWSETKGYFKLGYFSDSVERSFDQDSFTNSMDFSTFTGEFNEFWSASFPFETHPIAESEFDVDYNATQDIEAYYAMIDLPLTSRLKLVGGLRWESTDISLVNDPESRATWLPPGTNALTVLNPGDADVAFSQKDVLPSIGLDWRPTDKLSFRAAYNETIARQTFKELTPILQQEFLGGPIFIGNPGLQMSSVKNYDLRLDYRPTKGSLFSVSAFRKDIKNAIEYVQALEGSTAAFNFTTPVNYPEGTLKGFELEVRQELGEITSALEGLAIGANATFLDARVTLPDEEQQVFNRPNLMVPISERDMTNAPEQLFNFYLTYDMPEFGTQLGVFYTITGDTLLVGAGEAGGNFVPSTYAKQFGTLNLSLTQRIGDVLRLKVQAKNLTNPDIDTVYRSKYLDGGDVLRTSRSRGVEFSISLSGEIRF